MHWLSLPQSVQTGRCPFWSKCQSIELMNAGTYSGVRIV